MARYFFDIDDGNGVQHDEVGTEMGDIDSVREEARRILPDVAQDEIPRDGDVRTFTVLVTDEKGGPVYSATLSFAGLWLLRDKNT